MGPKDMEEIGEEEIFDEFAEALQLRPLEKRWGKDTKELVKTGRPFLEVLWDSVGKPPCQASLERLGGSFGCFW